MFLSGYYEGIVQPERVIQDFHFTGTTQKYTFRPQSNITRAEAFRFAKNVLDYSITPENVPVTPDSGSVTDEDIATIKADAYIEGDTDDATLLLVEYSDMECIYCKRMHDDLIIENLEKKYGNELAYSFQHFPLPYHDFALPAAHSAECVAEQGGTSAYYAFIDEVFSHDMLSQATIDAALSALQFTNNDAVQTCIREKKFQSRIESQMSEGKELFGIDGIPGNVIINLKTKKYEIIAGAQPEESFIEAADRLLQ